MLDTVIMRLLEALEQYYQSGEYLKPFKRKEIADCVIQHAAAGGVAAMAAGAIPAAGTAISLAIAMGAVWGMYIRICKMIHVELRKEMLKVLASAAISNIAINLGSVIAAELAISLIPGAGIVGAGIIAFAIVYIGGILFLQILTGLFKANFSDWNDLSEEELKEAAQSAAENTNVKAIFSEAKSLFKDMRKNGSLDKTAEGTDIDPEDDA